MIRFLCSRRFLAASSGFLPTILAFFTVYGLAHASRHGTSLPLAPRARKPEL